MGIFYISTDDRRFFWTSNRRCFQPSHGGDACGEAPEGRDDQPSFNKDYKSKKIKTQHQWNWMILQYGIIMDFIVILASCIMDFDIFWWTSVVTTLNIQCPSRGTEGSNTELWQARLDWPHLTWVASFGCVKTGTSHGERAQIMTKSYKIMVFLFPT